MELLKLTKEELAELCDKGALNPTGTKAELIARLKKNPHRLPAEEEEK